VRRCLRCGRAFSLGTAVCPDCGFSPALVDGHPAHAPGLASGAEAFRDDFFEQLALAERGHFWFRARAQLILWALRTYQPGLASFFDIGCGTGYNLAAVAKAFPDARLAGSELVASGLRYAGRLLPSLELMQMDARSIPFVDEFDAIGAFDILEHIEEDCIVLSQMCDALRPGGVALITVPQHKWLWSTVDRYSCHVRRYGSRELQDKVRDAGFEILRSTSFVFLPLPGLLVSRMRATRRAGPCDTSAELALPGGVNRILDFMLRLERHAIGMGIDLPAGGSRLVVARKPDRQRR
jgi:SAM-dependent methyltransferase